jgi:glucosylceramidase
MDISSPARAFISSGDVLFEERPVSATPAGERAEIVVDPEAGRQTIEGFGGCFNEKGWQALSVLSADERRGVMRALFAPGEGLGLVFGRVPIGASDYALDRYSLNETAGDYGMERFSIDRDRNAIIPYIKEALSIQPSLRLWGSAWTPPTWMKDNRSFDSGAFLDESEIYRAYALYLLKFIRAYRAEGLPMEAVAVQNEPATLTNYPSCDWTAKQYLVFIRDYLGPLFKKEGIQDAIILGTFNQPPLVAHALAVLKDPDARRYVARAGMQWYSIAFAEELKAAAPGLPIWQTETDCGNWHWLPGFAPDRPANDFAYAAFTWRQVREWLKAGASVYNLWNMVLDPEGKNIDSIRPWPQNAPVTVDPALRSVRYTPMFGAVGSFSRYLPPGSRLVGARGDAIEALAFTDPAGRVIVSLLNEKSEPVAGRVRIREAAYAVEMPAQSFGTLVIEKAPHR